MNVINQCIASLRPTLSLAGVVLGSCLLSACIVVQEKPADSVAPTATVTPPPPPPPKPVDPDKEKDDKTDKDGGTPDEDKPHRKPPIPASPGGKKEGDQG